MRIRLFYLLMIAGLLGSVLVVEAAFTQDLISSGESYALKKDQIGYYESILRKSVHTSRVDLVASVNVLAERASETHVAGALLVRPFSTLPVLGNQIIRDSRLYRETERQTGNGLSPEAVGRVDSIVEEVRAFQNRPVWQRTVILFGANIPYDPVANAAVDSRYHLNLGYEGDHFVVSLGATLEEHPRVVISAGFTIGSAAYAAGYAALERMETAFTDRRLYHTVDYDDVRPR